MGKNKITMDDVAKAAGVSKGAVSLAFSNSSAISAETAANIREAAHNLGYQLSPGRKKRGSGDKENWCLLFPYAFSEYSYTELDLMIIEYLESYAHQYHAELRVTRLSESGELPISTAGIDTFFIKSYKVNLLELCPQLRQTRNVVLFGFEDNTEIGTQAMHNPLQSTHLLLDEIRNSGCREIIVLHIDPDKGISLTWQDEIMLLSRLADSVGMNCRVLAAERDDFPEILDREISTTQGKVAIVGFRIGEIEHQIMKEISGQLTHGVDYECFMAEYNPLKMDVPGFHYLDMRGPDIIGLAVKLSREQSQPEHCQIMLSPRIFRK